jgi:hypothetical protein
MHVVAPHFVAISELAPVASAHTFILGVSVCSAGARFHLDIVESASTAVCIISAALDFAAYMLRFLLIFFIRHMFPP